MEEHHDAFTSELLRYGLHLTGPYRNATVDEAYSIAVTAQPGSPLAAALDESAAWPASAYLLASMEYSLRWLCWSKTVDGEKGRNRPAPPVTPASRPKPESETVGMSKERLADFLTRPRVEVTTITHSAK